MTRTRTRTRTLAGLTAAAALALSASPALSTASAAPARGTVPLEAGSQPEGIASQGTTYWAGARSDGTVP